MNNARNRGIYRLWAPVYDPIFRRLFGRQRHRAIELLALQPEERLLIPGIGTGLDLPYIPVGVSVTGTDISPQMLAKAASSDQRKDIELLEMDAQALDFPDAYFDAVLLNLILSVVPDAAVAFREAWRVLKPNGRLVIFDKFLHEAAHLSIGRRLIGQAIRYLGTDPNRRLSEIVQGLSDLRIELDEPGLLNGQYRTLLLCKRVLA
ncbi:MAG: methyltransferase domain-containing protein [Chloroflexi bacterium]|nr:methyltransferase domain-containing protein [Chloroflexota bacterium]